MIKGSVTIRIHTQTSALCGFSNDKVWPLNEGWSTLLTPVGLLPSVDPQVLSKAGSLRKPSQIPPMLLPSVASLTFHESWPLTEGPPTLITLGGLLPNVDPHVSNRVWALAEGLTALFIPIGSLPSMNSLMKNQAYVLTEGFLTFVTSIAYFIVNFLVWKKGWFITHSFPTWITLIRFLPSVHSPVLNKPWALTKGHPILLIFVLFYSCGVDLLLCWFTLILKSFSTPCILENTQWIHFCRNLLWSWFPSHIVLVSPPAGRASQLLKCHEPHIRVLIED